MFTIRDTSLRSVNSRLSSYDWSLYTDVKLGHHNEGYVSLGVRWDFRSLVCLRNVPVKKPLKAASFTHQIYLQPIRNRSQAHACSLWQSPIRSVWIINTMRSYMAVLETQTGGRVKFVFPNSRGFFMNVSDELTWNALANVQPFQLSFLSNVFCKSATPTGSSTLLRITSDVQKMFGAVGYYDFQACWAFVATWQNVTFYGGSRYSRASQTFLWTYHTFWNIRVSILWAVKNFQICAIIPAE